MTGSDIHLRQAIGVPLRPLGRSRGLDGMDVEMDRANMVRVAC